MKGSKYTVCRVHQVPQTCLSYLYVIVFGHHARVMSRSSKHGNKVVARRDSLPFLTFIQHPRRKPAGRAFSHKLTAGGVAKSLECGVQPLWLPGPESFRGTYPTVLNPLVNQIGSLQVCDKSLFVDWTHLQLVFLATWLLHLCTAQRML